MLRLRGEAPATIHGPRGGQRTPGPKGRRQRSERLDVVIGPIFDTRVAASEEED